MQDQTSQSGGMGESTNPTPAAPSTPMPVRAPPRSAQLYNGALMISLSIGPSTEQNRHGSSSLGKRLKLPCACELLFFLVKFELHDGRTPTIQEVPTPKLDLLEQKNRELDEKIEKQVKEHEKVIEKPLVVDNFPELNEEAMKVVRQALKPSEGIISEFQSIPIAYQDISRLKDRCWLNDELINFYGCLIIDRSNRLPERYPPVHFFNTFFIPTLREHGYTKVRRWTRKVCHCGYDTFYYGSMIV